MAPRSRKKPKKESSESKDKGKKKRRPDQAKSPSKDTHRPAECSSPEPLPNEPIELETPTKSPNDMKEYKIIQLNNGLKALLISDIICSEHRSSERIRQNRNCIDLQILKFNRDVLGIPPPESKDLTSEPSDPEYMEPRHASNCNCPDRTASVALCVAVGSLSEPPEVLGLAHFCEHMIFCGSKQYPKRSEFDLFVAANGGFTNGQTHCDHTLFTFHVNQSHFSQALDMFTSFFTGPLMDMDYMIAERDLVDDEFNVKKYLDDEKRAHILMLAGKKGHPVCQFSWGNKETLHTDDEEQAEKLHEHLLLFQQRYYGSESMYLAIQASEPMEKLEELVVEYFEQIPRSSVPKPVRNFELMPFDTPEFRKWYQMVPTHAFDLLYLTWEFPPKALQDYQAKPLAYIQRVLSNENKGGIANYLIEKNLISTISCSYGELQHEHSPFSTILTVSFHLVDIAQEKLNTIIEAFFSYIKFLIQLKPQEWFFNEFKTIRALELHYLDERDIKSNPMTLAEELRKRGPKDCIIGELLMTKWKPELIQEYTQMLVPEKANYMLLSQVNEIQKCCTLKEPYFGTEYSVRDIPQNTMQRWKNAKLISDFSFFKPNLFLTNNFCIIKEDSYSSPERLVVKNSDHIEMWHLLDTHDAEAEFRFLFMTETDLKDVKKSSSMSLWAGILGRLLRPRLYGAAEAKLSYSVSRCHLGIRAEVQGFSQNLDLIITEILNVAKSLSLSVQKKRDLFDSEKSVVSQRLRNDYSNHENLEKQLRSRIMLNACFTSIETHNALQHVSHADFVQFCKKFLAKMFTVGIVIGNVDEETAQDVACEIVNTFKYKSLLQPEDERPEILATELPLGESILCVRSLDRNSICSTISVYFQIGSVNMRSCLIAQLVMDTMNEPAFQELRVEKNLGYKVEVGVDVNIASSVAVFLKVTSQSKEFPGSYVVREIDEFLLEFYKSRIESMTEANFKKLKEDYGFAVRDSKSIFKEIMKQEYHFDRQKAEERIMPRIQLKEFKNWYEQYLLPSCTDSKMRKLVIQVVGSGDTEYPVQITQPWEIKSCPNEAKLVLLLPENASSNHIRDIVQFHKSLPVMPKHKLM